MKYSSFDCLIVERRGPVGWLINNRPDQLNAMSAQMRDEFAVAWKELDADPDVRVIVHTGEGRAFQTGVDVTEIATDGQGMERYRESVAHFDLHFTAWHQEVWKPVITAVNGLCAGGAFHWVADADIVIAASDAQFFDPHVSVGQVVAIEAIGLLRKMPVEAVMRMAFVGKYERLSAARAYELGMISQVVDPPEQLRDEAQALAEKIAQNSPAAMRATKKALWGALEMGLTDACRAGAGELVSMWGHPDQEEGPRVRREARSQLAGRRPQLTVRCRGGREPAAGGPARRRGPGRGPDLGQRGLPMGELHHQATAVPDPRRHRRADHRLPRLPPPRPLRHVAQPGLIAGPVSRRRRGRRGGVGARRRRGTTPRRSCGRPGAWRRAPSRGRPRSRRSCRRCSRRSTRDRPS